MQKECSAEMVNEISRGSGVTTNCTCHQCRVVGLVVGESSDQFVNFGSVKAKFQSSCMKIQVELIAWIGHFEIQLSLSNNQSKPMLG